MMLCSVADVRCATTTLVGYPRQRNGLNALRLVLALLVIVSHAWPIGGFGDDPRIGDLTLGTFAVLCFFAVSGWLITQSRMQSTLSAFAWRRALRVYPGYLVALVAVGYAFAPLGAWLAGTTYRPEDGAAYVLGNLDLRITAWTVGATLPATAYPAWNGALWSLWSEAVCYLVLGLLVLVTGRRWAGHAIVAGWAVSTGWDVAGEATRSVTPGLLVYTVPLLPYFFAGAALYVMRAWVPLDPVAAALAGCWLAVGLTLEAPHAAFAPAIAYLVLWVTARFPLDGCRHDHDFSYGLYIYGFPSAQLLALSGVPALLGVGGYAAATVLIAAPIAAVSWFLVERPALTLRSLVGARRVRPDLGLLHGRTIAALHLEYQGIVAGRPVESAGPHLPAIVARAG